MAVGQHVMGPMPMGWFDFESAGVDTSKSNPQHFVASISRQPQGDEVMGG